MGKTTKIWDRKFLGDTSFFSMNKDERNEKKEEIAFEKKHLKAYLKGHTTFTHGVTEITNPKTGLVVDRVPKRHTVKQELIKQ